VEASDTATFRCNAVYDSDLQLKIKWLKDGELIDFETEPRFIQSSDQSLTITKTTELDSGTYTCLAESDLDAARASATLIVQVKISSFSPGSIKHRLPSHRMTVLQS
jgi:neuronal cell adhesion protein